jgi:hypothetical protein
MKIIIFVVIATTFFILSAGRISAEHKRSIDLKVNLQAISKDTNQSSIIISYLSNRTWTGISFQIPFSVYRGATLKRTIYVWIQDASGKRISSKAKFSLPERFREYNLTAELNISGCHESEAYTAVADGLGINSTSAIDIIFPGCENISLGSPDNNTVQKDISFSVLEYPKEIESGKSFSSRLLISNPTGKYLDVDAWSYVYRSSKSYSGEREQNRKSINVPEYSNITFDLDNIVNATGGEYILKIKLLRSDRKAPTEINLPIVVSGSSSKESSDLTGLSVLDNNDEEKIAGNSSPKKKTLFSSGKNSSGNISIQGGIYESSSVKARNLAVYILIGVLALILVVLIFKKL